MLFVASISFFRIEMFICFTTVNVPCTFPFEFSSFYQILVCDEIKFYLHLLWKLYIFPQKTSSLSGFYCRGHAELNKNSLRPKWRYKKREKSKKRKKVGWCRLSGGFWNDPLRISLTYSPGFLRCRNQVSINSLSKWEIKFSVTRQFEQKLPMISL